MTEKERKAIYIGGNVLLSIIKWILLIVTVLTAGFTIGLIVMVVINGKELAPDVIVNFTNILLPYKDTQVKLMVDNYGMQKVLIATIGYGISYAISSLLYYILIIKSKKLFKSITLGDLFTKNTIDEVDEMISISFMATFLMPIMLFIISTTTNLLTDAYISVGYGGVFFLVFTFIIKIILERGMTLAKQSNKYDRAIDDYKADIDELKLQSIKREAELKELKKLVKQEEKVEEVKEETTKKRKHHHSRAKKGTTAK